MKFYKYQGTGNDFVMIDNRQLSFDTSDLKRVQELCDRRFGIGGDGLICLQNKAGIDFEMIYFNADGSQSFCGNGARSTVAFARDLGIVEHTARFEAIDGLHEAEIDGEQIRLKMGDVEEVEAGEGYYFIDTGSPHYIVYVEDVEAINLVEAAHEIRYNDRFKAEGTNVNFVQVCDGFLKVRTYERGVEGETLSCGTGVTAVALSAAEKGIAEGGTEIQTRGGKLHIAFEKSTTGYREIYLKGPALQTFTGEVK